jgi:hypothetical protein
MKDDYKICSDQDQELVINLLKEIFNLCSIQQLSISQSQHSISENHDQSKDDDLQVQLIVEKFENLLEIAKTSINLFKVEINSNFFQFYELVLKQLNNFLFANETQSHSSTDEVIIYNYLELIHILCKFKKVFY